MNQEQRPWIPASAQLLAGAWVEVIRLYYTSAGCELVLAYYFGECQYMYRVSFVNNWRLHRPSPQQEQGQEPEQEPQCAEDRAAGGGEGGA